MFGLGGAIVCLTAVLAAGGPLTGVNLLVNGEFEAGPPGEVLPTGWTDFDTDDPSGWNGVMVYGSLIGHPLDRPDGQTAPSQCYGGASTWLHAPYGILGESIGSGDPGEVWIGGWVYTADVAGAYARFHLDQSSSGMTWSSDPIYELVGGNPGWTWHEFTIPGSFGFGAGELVFRVELQLGEGTDSPPYHGMMVDGLELESELIPEPASVMLLGPASVALLFSRPRRRS
jgi:hypothetical protein